MVTRKEYRSIENPIGVGEVWNKGERISKVEYGLIVQQEVLIASDFQKSEETELLKSISGSISVLEGIKDLWDKGTLTLTLQDGRKVDFFVKSGDPVSGNFTIQPTGNFY